MTPRLKQSDGPDWLRGSLRRALRLCGSGNAWGLHAAGVPGPCLRDARPYSKSAISLHDVVARIKSARNCKDGSLDSAGGSSGALLGPSPSARSEIRISPMGSSGLQIAP